MGTLTYTRYLGRGREKEIVREVHETVDARNFQGTPGQPWLLIAANPQLSAPELVKVFEALGIERNATWIRRRRWMFEPEAVRKRGPQPNADGKDEHAFSIMSQNLRLSLLQTRSLLEEHGIKRSKDWIRRWKLTKPTYDAPDKKDR